MKENLVTNPREIEYGVIRKSFVCREGEVRGKNGVSHGEEGRGGRSWCELVFT